jgi:DNA polymerase III epsilon subunit-like protein
VNLIWDTESSGLSNFKAPPSDPSQPHIVQLAALLVDDDGREVDSMNTLIKPVGWSIPPDATRVHGISTAEAAEKGIPIKDALAKFSLLKKQANVIIGHNIEFDRFLYLLEVFRGWGKWIEWAIPKEKCFCTMLATKNILKLPGRYGDFKYPKLMESYKFAFKKEFDDAHDALADVRATKEIYFWLKNRQVQQELPIAA